MFTEIVSGVGMFILIVLALVALILVARSKLVASGGCNILINGDESKAMAVPAGAKLLNVLADNKIFVSSACGGVVLVHNVKSMCTRRWRHTSHRACHITKGEAQVV